MNKQIKRLLLAKLSSKRKLAKSLDCDLPVSVRIWEFNSLYTLDFDEDDIFYFSVWVKSNDTFYCKQMESYPIKGLKQELKLADVWFEPFINEE